MSRTGYFGPRLPKTLLDQVSNTKDSRFKQNGNSRKAQRKAERLQKKASRAKNVRPGNGLRRREIIEDEAFSSSEDGAPKVPKSVAREVKKDVAPPKSILKKSKPSPAVLWEESNHEDDEGSTEEEISAPIVSKAVKARLEEDDDEIAALEKKLGIKSGKKSKALVEDGLDWLAGGSGSEDESSSLKRKRPEDTQWLRDKRLKATGHSVEDAHEDEGSSSGESAGSAEEEDDDDEAIQNPFSDDEIDSDDFDGLGSDDDEDVAPPPKRRKENPYVAPGTDASASAGKYIPPSLRKPASTDEEALHQLQKQIKGLLNRLSEANLISILGSIEDLYTKNARQHVTSTLVNLLVGLVSDRAILNDTFLILYAGFAEAVYKVIGTDFGAQLLEKLVEAIDRFHGSNTTDGKQSLNLLAFLSNLYNFQLVGSTILFDFIRILLGELSESNTELLLRIIRTSGQQLRQDDPSALKDIVLLLQRSVAKVGEENLSVRTRFMMETINNLKNNRMKTGAAVSALAAEHTTHVKKVMSTLSTSRSIKATEPLRISLSDLRNTEKEGKWWLVGASYNDPLKHTTTHTSTSTTKALHDAADAGYESETPGSVNLNRLARQQGMNTDVRRAIFIALLSSTDYQEAHTKILKLHLKNKQMLEVPRVLVHCVGAEEVYNPFYALVGRRFCGEHRMRKALMFGLWDFLRRLEGSADDEEEEQTLGTRKVVNVAKFYGSLIADKGLSLAVLKKLSPDFAYLGGDVVMFVEVLLTTIFLQIRKVNAKDEAASANQAQEVFGSAAGAGNVIPGLRYILEKTVAKTELARTKKEKRAVQAGCDIAVDALEEAARAGVKVEEEEEEDSDSE